MKGKKMGKNPPQKAKQMGCETADRENVFIKRRVLWVTLLLRVQLCSCWRQQEFWQLSARGPDRALPFPPIDAVWTLFFLSGGFVVVTTLSNLLVQFCEVSPGTLRILLRWCEIVPHLSHGGCHLGARRLLLPTGVLWIPHSRPMVTCEGTCHLQEIFSPRRSWLWPAYSWVYHSMGGRAACKTCRLDNGSLQFYSSPF